MLNSIVGMFEAVWRAGLTSVFLAGAYLREAWQLVCSQLSQVDPCTWGSFLHWKLCEAEAMGYREGEADKG